MCSSTAVHPYYWPLFLLIFSACTLSCGDANEHDPTRDLRVITQQDILRAKLGETIKSSFTIINANQNPVQFTIESHAPQELLQTAQNHGTLPPKSAHEINLTATCPQQDGQFLMKLTATNDIPQSQPVDIFLRLQCGWVAADPETIGNLLVIIEGLPENTNANIAIEGPHDFHDTVNATTTIRGLPLGRYILTADPLTINSETFNPAPLTFSLIVTNDNKARASFRYTPDPDSTNDPDSTSD